MINAGLRQTDLAVQLEGTRFAALLVEAMPRRRVGLGARAVGIRDVPDEFNSLDPGRAVDYNSRCSSRQRSVGYPLSREGANVLAEVAVGENETLEAAPKRFTKRVQQNGILAEARRPKHYEKPSVRRKMKEAAKRRESRR